MIPDMTNVTRTFFFLVALFLALPALADYYDGLREWDAGRYREALNKWQAAASEGDTRSMMALGRLYVKGLGAPQDYIEAHKWFNLAASRGLEEALAERDAIAEKMTPAQIATAQERAASWQPATRGDEKQSETLLAQDAVVRAAEAGDVDGLQKALAAGADVNARDEEGWTALMYVTDQGSMLLVELMLAAGADPNIRLADGATALFIAVVRGHTEIVTLLLEAGADPNIRLADGATALFIAVVHGYTEIVTALVEAGADPLIKGPEGETALDVVRMRGDPTLLAALGILETGDVFRDCQTCPEMVVVPAGSFLMGSPPTEEGHHDSQGPQHRVTIADPFAVGKYEVKRSEYAEFVQATGLTDGKCNTSEGDDTIHSWRDPDFAQGADHPVVCVSWDDARAYVNWLSRKTGKSYRLPSESEWEYVARGGTHTARYWGEGVEGQCRHANGRDLSDKLSAEHGWTAPCDDGYEYTAPVGLFTKNGFGLHDVLGNVWEWTQDCWNDSYTGAPGDGRAWETGDCHRRVLRGGDWAYEPWGIRSAFRNYNRIGYRSDRVGFRVARTLD